MPQVNTEWQKRQIAMTRARIQLSELWAESDLSPLEWMSVLADELSSVANRHRNRVENNPLTGPVSTGSLPVLDPGEPIP